MVELTQGRELIQHPSPKGLNAPVRIVCDNQGVEVAAESRGSQL